VLEFILTIMLMYTQYYIKYIKVELKINFIKLNFKLFLKEKLKGQEPYCLKSTKDNQFGPLKFIFCILFDACSF